MRFLAVSLLLLLATPLCFAARKKHPKPNPVAAWGTITNNTGCVIFQQSIQHNGDYTPLGGNVTYIGKLTVVETENYAMPRKPILETPENMNALMQRAHRDRVKYIKLPQGYSRKLLNEARAMCKANQAKPQ